LIFATKKEKVILCRDIVILKTQGAKLREKTQVENVTLLKGISLVV